MYSSLPYCQGDYFQEKAISKGIIRDSLTAKGGIFEKGCGAGRNDPDHICSLRSHREQSS
jgi:hypothetical protein